MEPESLLVENRHGSYGGRSFSCTGCDPAARAGADVDGESLTCAVRYGLMNYIGEFRYSPKALSGCGGRVVVQTNRGIEIGERVSLTCTGCRRFIGRRQVEAYIRGSGTDFCQPRAGRVLRVPTQQDLLEEARINADAELKLQSARELVRSRNLNLTLVACEHLFGGERIIFHFMADDRVDFRDLVRDLAHEYRTRIEMHQIGARDEARLVADYEICGRECCCRNFLKKLRPVTMRMAKLQKATLDPSKVSGRCGRLRCCLRYEHEGYEELNARLPRAGARVRTERGIGTIKDRHILTQLLTIEYDDSGYFEVVGLEAILETGLPKRPPPPSPSDATPVRGSAEEDRRNQRRPVRREQAGGRHDVGQYPPSIGAASLPPGAVDDAGEEGREGDPSGERSWEGEPPGEPARQEPRPPADEGPSQPGGLPVRQTGSFAPPREAGVGEGGRRGRRRRRRRGRRGGRSEPGQ